MSFTYTPTVPVANHFPSDDQPVMNANFQYLIPSASLPGTGLQRDHAMSLLSTTPSDGTHQQVTMNANLGGSPSLAGAVNVLYPATGTGQSQLFFSNSAKTAVQLTTVLANVPTLGTTGASFLPGGLLIQWGTGSGTLTFTRAFTTIYSVTATSLVTTNFPWYISSQTNATVTVTQTGGGAFAYNYIAIGLA